MNRFFGIIAILTLLSVTCLAQRSKVVIIDTLYGMGKLTSKTPFKTKLLQNCSDDGDFLNDTAFKNLIINLEQFPNLILPAMTANGICLLLDNKGGTLQLNNVDKLNSDTIRISSWTVYSNGLTDSVSGYKVYHQMVNDSMYEKPLSNKPVIRYTRNAGVSNLKSVFISINGKKYLVPITVSSEITVTSFHGYEPKNVHAAFLKNSSKRKRVYRYKYFFGEYSTSLQKYMGGIDF